MKFAYAGPASGRVAMRERQRRDRLSTPALRVRYPQFQSVRIEFKFIDSGPFTPAAQATVLHPAACAYFSFPCPYSDCDGEFNLSSQVSAMAREQGAHSAGELKCAGHRNGEAGPMACGLTLKYSIAAERS
jgi:hypothetical protein